MTIANVRPAIAVAFISIALTSANAQQRRQSAKYDPIAVGSTFVGPMLGVGAIGSANVAFGGRFETIVASLPSIDNGKLGLELGVDYYGWSGSGYSLSYVPIGASANYHFSIDDPKLDAFVGLGLGYSIVSLSGVGSEKSSLYTIARGGFRYFLNRAWAVQVDAGTGGAMGNVGFMLRL